MSARSEVCIHWIDEDGSETACPVLVTWVSRDEFRIRDAGDLFGAAFQYGDLVQLRPRGEPDHYDLLQRSCSGGFRKIDYGIPKEVSGSLEFRKFLKVLNDQGAYWEQVFGGMLLVFLPPNAAYDPWPDLVEVFKKVHRDGPTPIEDLAQGPDISQVRKREHRIQFSLTPAEEPSRQPERDRPKPTLKDRILGFMLGRRRR